MEPSKTRSQAVPTVYTIGFQRKPLSKFINLLRQAGVDAVIDVRLRNTSQLAGYSKRNDLDFLLTHGFGIAYEHHPELAPSNEIFDAYREEKDWDAYTARFKPLLAERQAEAVGRDVLSRYQSPCLLCSEPTSDQCHRRLVAEHWAAHIPDLTIVHL
jgi:uncharacterized protein (DUF488 family)